MKIDKAYVGKWRITEMEQWGKDYVDMVVPGHLTIGMMAWVHFNSA